MKSVITGKKSIYFCFRKEELYEDRKKRPSVNTAYSQRVDKTDT